jgi:hypothetical protein
MHEIGRQSMHICYYAHTHPNENVVCKLEHMSQLCHVEAWSVAVHGQCHCVCADGRQHEPVKNWPEVEPNGGRPNGIGLVEDEKGPRRELKYAILALSNSRHVRPYSTRAGRSHVAKLASTDPRPVLLRELLCLDGAAALKGMV